MKNKFLFFSIFILFYTFSIFPLIENSVIPLIENIQNKGIPKTKLTQTQKDRIKEASPFLVNKLRVMSYNMLYSGREHSMEEKYHWKNRLPRIVDFINFSKPDIIGVQELLPKQAEELYSKIKNDYGFIEPRLDAHINWEEKSQDGIFFKKSRIQLIKSQFLFESSTPYTPSENPFGEKSLIAEGVFKLIETNKTFTVLNAHTSFYNADSREYSAKFIAKYTKTLPENQPLFVIGDFNTFPFQVDNPLIPFFDGDLFQTIITSGPLRDARTHTIMGSFGPLATFTNDPSLKEVIPFTGLGVPGVFLDHIYINNAVTIINFAIDPVKVDGLFPSDHMPIYVDAILKTETFPLK